MNLTDLKKKIYETVVLQNAMRMDLNAEFVIVHESQRFKSRARKARRH